MENPPATEIFITLNDSAADCYHTTDEGNSQLLKGFGVVKFLWLEISIGLIQFMLCFYWMCICCTN